MLAHLYTFARLNRRLLLGVLGLAALCLIGGFVVWAIFLYQDVRIPQKDKIPDAEIRSLVPTELSLTLSMFGPWETPFAKNERMSTEQLLLLKESGGLSASLYGIRFPDENWSALKPPEISRLTVDGYMVRLTTNKGRTFEVSTNQPFILEQTPEMIYLVTADRKIWAINTEKGEALRYNVTSK